MMWMREDIYTGGGGGKGSVRRKWEGRNTVVYDSGLKVKEVVRGLRVVEDDSVEFGGRKVFEFGAKGREVVEEESVELGGRRGRKANAFVSDSGVKENEGARVVKEMWSLDFRDQKSKEKEVVRGAEYFEGRSVGVQRRKRHGVKLEERNVIVLD